MISPLNRFTSIPNTSEGMTGSPGINIGGAGSGSKTFTLLSNIPCGHAHEIVVFIQVPVVASIVLRSYGMSRSLIVDTTLAAAVGAGTYSYKFVGPVGQSFDLRVTNGVADLPANTFAAAWACAKA